MSIQLDVSDNLWQPIEDTPTFSQVGIYRVMPIVEGAAETSGKTNLSQQWTLLELVRNDGSSDPFWIVAYDNRMCHGADTKEGALKFIENVEQLNLMHIDMIKNANIETADAEGAEAMKRMILGDDGGDNIWDGPQVPRFDRLRTRTGRTNTRDGGPIANSPKGPDLTS